MFGVVSYELVSLFAAEQDGVSVLVCQSLFLTNPGCQMVSLSMETSREASMFVISKS
uniref:Uncharacterized protein n=1 Tax=Medicago truncatula TaxID=3880 RepID=A2Q4N2_MEDTR|nr:hypothetical protein MtrDRAFT_AC157506g45v2 [Medicago truncatula]